MEKAGLLKLGALLLLLLLLLGAQGEAAWGVSNEMQMTKSYNFPLDYFEISQLSI